MSHDFSAQFQDGTLAKTFALAGRARLTVRSCKTGVRFTFRIVQRDEKKPHFVSLLTGPDNTHSYTYIGTIFEGQRYAHGKKSTISADASSNKAFAWVWAFLSRGELPPGCEVWHEGTCARCGRALTVPESVSRGLGPDCAEAMGLAA